MKKGGGDFDSFTAILCAWLSVLSLFYSFSLVIVFVQVS